MKKESILLENVSNVIHLLIAFVKIITSWSFTSLFKSIKRNYLRPLI